jgi:hypothetical protein
VTAVCVSVAADANVLTVHDELIAAGLLTNSRRPLVRLRVLSGNTEDLPALRRFPGVAAVELDREVTAQ